MPGFCGDDEMVGCFDGSSNRLPDEFGIIHNHHPGLLIGVWAATLANFYFGLVPALPLELSGSAAALLLEHMP